MQAPLGLGSQISLPFLLECLFTLSTQTTQAVRRKHRAGIDAATTAFGPPSHERVPAASFATAAAAAETAYA